METGDERWQTVAPGIDVDLNRRQKPPPPLCVFCSKPWTDEMVRVFTTTDIVHGYYGSTYVEGVDVVIDVICSHCGRLVYRKEIRDTDPERT